MRWRADSSGCARRVRRSPGRPPLSAPGLRLRRYRAIGCRRPCATCGAGFQPFKLRASSCRIAGLPGCGLRQAANGARALV
ncbi:hypothetical protein DIJ60_18515, partial [Burkholderia pseudomallei]